MAKKQPRCKYCEEGNKPNEKGDHWIVKSIIPARIDIRRCKLAETQKSREQQPTT